MKKRPHYFKRGELYLPLPEIQEYHMQNLFQNFLEQNALPNVPAELYEPCKYMLALGGKRIRPNLLLLAYEMFEFGQLERALPAAAAIELFHNFSLMHDDIMDAAPLRRGRETAHIKFGLNAGILSGDALLIHAYNLLINHCDKNAVPDLLKIFTKTAIEVCEGQQMDMNFENKSEVTVQEYLKMIELKTAVLLGASLEMGGICAGAFPQMTKNICMNLAVWLALHFKFKMIFWIRLVILPRLGNK